MEIERIELTDEEWKEEKEKFKKMKKARGSSKRL